MLALAADENFNNNILRGVLRRNPRVDIVRVQDVGLSGASDEIVLDWAAEAGRVLLTHDASTLTRYAYGRIKSHLRMPGVFEVNCNIPVGRAVEDILLLAELSLPHEWENQVNYLPL
jgi:hypothetical protein